jgi:hypothetical protein
VPTTRQRIGHRMVSTITPQAIEAWKQGDYHACLAALGLGPWDHDPFHTTSPEPPGWLVEHAARGSDIVAGPANRRRAWQLRQALIEAAGPPGHFDRHGRPLGPARARRT